MKQELKDLIWKECNKANNFIEIPAIYRHFKEAKGGEDMIYAVSNISVPLDDEELKEYVSSEVDKVFFYHTEKECSMTIFKIGDKYFHNRIYENEKLVIYTALYGDRKTYVRPLPMFLSRVDKAKYPNATQKFRLERVM